MLVSTIIPIRHTPNRDLASRLRDKRAALPETLPSDMEWRVVDDGSSRAKSPALEALCTELGFAYDRIESGDLDFSLARARNHGAVQALGHYLLFEDADLLPTPEFHSRLRTEIAVQQLGNTPERFMVFGAIYLTEEGSGWYRALPAESQFSELLQAGFEIRPSHVEQIVPVTSSMLLSRDYFLAIGGYDEGFAGWGFEDSDLAFRLLSCNQDLPKPKRFDWLNLQQYRFQTRYAGWRAMFRILGDISLAKGMLYAHLHHPVDQGLRQHRNANLKHFLRNAKVFSTNGHQLEVLGTTLKPEEMTRLRAIRPAANAHPTIGMASPLFDRYRPSLMSIRDKRNQFWQRLKHWCNAWF